MHEPIIVGLTLHFITFPPWELKNDKHILDLGREVSRLWHLMDGNAGIFLRKLLELPAMLESMQ